MKQYIFLADSISHVGGSQLYVSSKVNWLESEGWQVTVFFERFSDDIVLDNLKRFRGNYLPALSVPFAIADEKTRKRTAKRVVPTSGDKVIIECHLSNYCFWGEYFGNLCGGMTVCYPLSEAFAKMDQGERDFFFHKLKQNLLFGIADNSIPLMLGKCALTENRALSAVGCKANVSDEDYTLPIREDAKTILSFGRLEKYYIPNMVSSIKKFLNRHKDSFFNIVLLGDTTDQTVKDSIFSSLSECPNSMVFCTGYLNPVPKSIFEKSDVAIASAGSVKDAAAQGVLSISVDAFDYKAIGIYGVTTDKSLFRDGEKPIEIDDLLEDILINNKYSRKDIKPVSRSLDYSKHKEIIDRYAPNVPYEIHFSPLTLKNKIKRVFISVVGCEIYVKYFAVIPLYVKLKELFKM